MGLFIFWFWHIPSEHQLHGSRRSAGTKEMKVLVLKVGGICCNSHDTSAIYYEIYMRNVVCLHTVNTIKQKKKGKCVCPAKCFIRCQWCAALEDRLNAVKKMYIIHIAVFWYMTPCSLLGRYWRYILPPSSEHKWAEWR